MLTDNSSWHFRTSLDYHSNDVCTRNSLGRQIVSPSGAKEYLFPVQNNKDYVFLWSKGKQSFARSLFRRLEALEGGSLPKLIVLNL